MFIVDRSRLLPTFLSAISAPEPTSPGLELDPSTTPCCTVSNVPCGGLLPSRYPGTPEWLSLGCRAVTWGGELLDDTSSDRRWNLRCSCLCLCTLSRSRIISWLERSTMPWVCLMWGVRMEEGIPRAHAPCTGPSVLPRAPVEGPGAEAGSMLNEGRPGRLLLIAPASLPALPTTAAPADPAPGTGMPTAGVGATGAIMLLSPTEDADRAFLVSMPCMERSPTPIRNA
mmetsp:Transcript_34808/g.77392  ORF Transcript_34808/g.77392 Transcript_34808/m.77392 type:complete len:228 (-) Transcript_34808:44-727(-)